MTGRGERKEKGDKKRGERRKGYQEEGREKRRVTGRGQRREG